MKISGKSTGRREGVTLIELTVVIAVLTVLVSIAGVSISAFQDWRQGLQAGEQLKAVYQAQKLYLADNPTATVGSIDADDITPYLPNNMAAIPQITGLDGTARDIIITVSPPTISGGYDPSGSADDSIWDAGK